MAQLLLLAVFTYLDANIDQPNPELENTARFNKTAMQQDMSHCSCKTCSVNFSVFYLRYLLESISLFFVYYYY